MELFSSWLFLHSISGPFLDFFFFFKSMFASFIILKQMREREKKKWDSVAFKVALGKWFYSLAAK